MRNDVGVVTVPHKVITLMREFPERLLKKEMSLMP